MSDYDSNHYKGPDPEIDGDLMDREWQPSETDFLPERDDNETVPPPRSRSIGRWIFATLALVGLLSIAVGNVLNITGGPSPDFLQRSRQLHNEPLIQQLRDAVVHIQTSRPRSAHPTGQGTGFNIHPSGLIVTNRHVIEHATSIRVTFHGKMPLLAREWTVHPRVDLALIELHRPNDNLPALTLRPQLPPIGSPVYILGSPLGFSTTAMDGTVRSYVRMTGIDHSPMSAIEIEAPIQPGSSGSPVLDTEGHVIGVVFAQIARRDRTDLRGLAIPIGELDMLLDN